MGDKAPQEIRERVWVEKIDKSGEVPRVVETVFVERQNGVVTEHTVTREEPQTEEGA